jgi:hypothetical protein
MAPETRDPVSRTSNQLQQKDSGQAPEGVIPASPEGSLGPAGRPEQQHVAEATQRQIDQFLLYPKGKVVGVIDSAAQLDGALTTLADLGISRHDIMVFSGDEGIRRIDPRGRFHGLLGRLTRIVQSLGEELAHLKRYENELRAGHFLVVISADPERREEIGRAIGAHGGHFVDYYGTLTIEHLVP